MTEVKHLVLYSTNLVRIPPEIAAMASLDVFEPHTSHRLHRYPHELTRWVGSAPGQYRHHTRAVWRHQVPATHHRVQIHDGADARVLTGP
ncbi:hypothetical protein [Allorhizocola rhizosphaerae]|uniref:hypothetical protein n=1 Tax=Allorhizocola rhizosphaerae TaxID=1872709 RepID=UPI001FE45063|nr:hypothetical protein [Allorhizocola rhizosphaerae]